MEKTYEEKANDLSILCQKVIKEICLSDDEFKELIIPLNDNSLATLSSFQYANVIYWYRVLFKEPMLHDNGKTIFGFHIMPYQITTSDIKRAVKNNYGKFNEIINSNDKYIDFDSTTCNFHKVPNSKYQIVLIDEFTHTKYNHNGPGRPVSFEGNIDCFKENKSASNYEKIDRYIKAVKEDNMYFPNLLKNDIDADIKEQINKSLTYLKKKKHS